MITPAQAGQLHYLINQFADAREASNWSGAGRPEDVESLKHEFKVARAELEGFIRGITKETT